MEPVLKQNPTQPSNPSPKPVLDDVKPVTASAPLPLADQPVTDVEAAAPSANTIIEPQTVPEPQSADTPPPEAPKLAQAALPAPKRRGKGVIVLAILLALIIAGLAVYLYMKSKDTTTSTTTTKTTTTTNTSSTPQSDIDQANQSVDKNLKSVNNSQAYPANDLSDSYLGL